MESKTVHAYVYNPATSLFKSNRNDKADAEWITCKNSENCELLKKGECARRGVLGIHACPYGSNGRATGYTRKARNFNGWISDQKKKFEGVPHLKQPKKRLAFIGDYVYLPYSFIDMNKDIPFLRHGGFMSSGTPFLLKSDWNIETVRSIINFRPQAMMGGTITSYATEELPLFVRHLRECDPELFQRVMDAYPVFRERYGADLENYVGRTAILKTLQPPFEFLTEGYEGKYKVLWKWDGKLLTTDSRIALASWAKIDQFEDMLISLVPNDKTAVKVLDNSWVISETVFVD